jgi:transcriptional regulator with XRE-family HTH domain
MNKSNAISTIESELGQQLRAQRLRKDLDQITLARRAGIALNAVKNLESGKGATLASFISVLRVLDRAEWLHSLAPEISVSPMQMLRTKRPRVRASHKKGGGLV